MDLEIDVDLRNQEDFERLAAERPEIIQRTTIEEQIRKIAKFGAFDPFMGYLPPHSIEIVGENYRETLFAQSAISRSRAALLTIADFIVLHGAEIDVFACERVSPFAQRLNAIFQSRFIGSEYLPTKEARAKFHGVLHQNVQALSFSDRSFDVYVSCEVLEHVPDVQKTLSEAYRILRPGGLFVGTVPFLYRSERTIVRSRMINSNVVYLMEPEYHGNPVDPSGGSLVFELSGWDIIDRFRSAGFKDAKMRFIGSRKYAILGAEIAGVFVFEASA